MKHGTISGYQHHKCRCTDCCNAKREYEKNRIQKPKFVYPKPLEHGTSEAYSFGCTCDLCLTKGRNEYLAEIAA